MFKKIVIVCSMLLFSSILLNSCSTHGHNDDSHHDDSNHWRAPASSRKMMNPMMGDYMSAGRGKMLFEEKCSNCHGFENDDKEEIEEDNDSDEIVPPHVTLLGGHHQDGEIAWKIKTGKGKMPSWQKKLKDQQVWDIVNYLQSLKSEMIQ